MRLQFPPLSRFSRWRPRIRSAAPPAGAFSSSRRAIGQMAAKILAIMEMVKITDFCAQLLIRRCTIQSTRRSSKNGTKMGTSWFRRPRKCRTRTSRTRTNRFERFLKKRGYRGFSGESSTETASAGDAARGAMRKSARLDDAHNSEN